MATSSVGIPPVPPLSPLGFQDPVWAKWLNELRNFSVSFSIDNITFAPPLSTTGGATPVVSIQKASATDDGYLSSADWNTFNLKLSPPTYSRTVPATGFSITLGDTLATAILEPAGVLATGTVTLAATPVDGFNQRVVTTQTITALTFAPNVGQTVVNAPTTLTAVKASATFLYRLSTKTWYYVG